MPMAKPCNGARIYDFSSLPALYIIPLTSRIPQLSYSDIDRNIPFETNFSYYTPDQFHNNLELRDSIINPKSFTVLHCNIRSLSKNHDNLTNLLSLIQHPFSIIGISETKIIKDHDCLTNIQLSEYSFESQPTSSNAGGVGLYISNNLSYSIREDLSSALCNDFEMLWAEIDNVQRNIICGVVYRHPNGNMINFMNCLNSILDIVNLEKKLV